MRCMCRTFHEDKPTANLFDTGAEIGAANARDGPTFNRGTVMHLKLAQPGSALPSDGRGRRFESCISDS
jgi:hypothetical protein